MVDYPLKITFDFIWKKWYELTWSEEGHYEPRFNGLPGGSTWNMNWYRDLNDLVTLPDEDAFVEVSEDPMHIPASFNAYSRELDSLRKMT